MFTHRMFTSMCCPLDDNEERYWALDESSLENFAGQHQPEQPSNVRKVKGLKKQGFSSKEITHEQVRKLASHFCVPG